MSVPGAPYRPPADGWPVKYFNGSLYQHADKSLRELNLYGCSYDGKVIQPDGVSLGSPYARVVGVECGEWYSCRTNPDWCCSISDTPNWEANHTYAVGDVVADGISSLQRCTVGGTSGSTYPVFSGGVTVESTGVTWEFKSYPANPTANGCPHIDWIGNQPIFQYNLASPFPAPDLIPGGKVNYANCEQVGYKNVQARRQWHGRRGWLDLDYATADTDCPSATPVPKQYLGYQESPGQTKYLTLSGSCVSSVWQSGDVPEPTRDTATVTAESSVARHTGILSKSGTFNRVQDGISFGCGETGPTYTLLRAPTNDILVLPYGLTDPETVSLAAALFKANYERVNGSTYTLPAKLPSGFEMSDSFIEEHDGYTATFSVSISVYRSNTNYSWSAEFSIIEDIPGFLHTDSGVSSSGSLTLSDPITSEDIQADLDLLLSEWDLTDNRIYPWRADNHCNFAPLVTRNEQSDVQPTLSIQCEYPPDPNSTIYDGSILGAPNRRIVGGHEDKTAVATEWFDPRYEQWKFAACPLDDPPTPHWFVEKVGQVNRGVARGCEHASAGLPLTATQVTNCFHGSLHGGGAFTRDNLDGGYGLIGGVWRQKYAEVKLLWPSYNFAGPYGKDKFSILNETAACVQSKVDNVITIAPVGNQTSVPSAANLPGGTYGINVGDKILVSQDGVYEVSAVSAASTPTLAQPWPTYDITLGTKLSDCPSEIDPGTGGARATCGKLRFWDCPPFGLEYIAPVYYSGSGTTSLNPTNALNFIASTATAIDVDLYAQVRNVDNQLVPAQTPLATVTIPLVTATRADSAIYAAGDKIRDGAGNIQIVTVPGTSGGTAPTFASTIGVSTTDGGVTWVCVGLKGKYFVAAGDHSAAKYVVSNGFKPQWDDTGSKGDVVTAEWLIDPRKGGEYGRLDGVTDCDGAQVTRPTPDFSGERFSGYKGFSATKHALPFSPCAPAVICYSNNARDTFKNGITLPIPTIELDGKYGAAWYGQVLQAVTNPKWQVPPQSCANVTACGEDSEANGSNDPFYTNMETDNGMCFESYECPGGIFCDPLATFACTRYHQKYAFPDLIEPFTGQGNTLPSTLLLDGTPDSAPDPASNGLRWKIYSPVTTDPLAVPADGNILLPSSGIGLVPWEFYVNACNTTRQGECTMGFNYEWACRKWAGANNPGPDL